MCHNVYGGQRTTCRSWFPPLPCGCWDQTLTNETSCWPLPEFLSLWFSSIKFFNITITIVYFWNFSIIPNRKLVIIRQLCLLATPSLKLPLSLFIILSSPRASRTWTCHLTQCAQDSCVFGIPQDSIPFKGSRIFQFLYIPHTENIYPSMDRRFGADSTLGLLWTHTGVCLSPAVGSFWSIILEWHCWSWGNSTFWGTTNSGF